MRHVRNRLTELNAKLITIMANKTTNFDLISIDGGPAGITAAATASARNKTVALVDSHHQLGGEGYTFARSERANWVFHRSSRQKLSLLIANG